MLMMKEVDQQRLTALTGKTPFERYESIRQQTLRVKSARDHGEFDLRPIDFKEWVCRQFEICAMMSTPPPIELVELTAQLLRVDRPRRSKPRNPEKFLACIEYVAENPSATVSEVRRAIDYDQQRQIRQWLNSHAFQEAVVLRRFEMGITGG